MVEPPVPPSDEAIIRAVADDLPVGVWVARAPGGQFVYANRQFADIMGMGARSDVAAGEYAAPYGIHTRTGELYPEDRMPFVRALQERQVVTVDDIVIHRADGGRVNIRAQARPMFDASGALTHVVIAFIDITREVVAESARAESEARLVHAQKMDSIGNLAGGVAHDFNNLLGALKLLGQLLHKDESDPHKLAYIEQIEHITDSASQLTRSLLGFAQRGKNLSQPLSLNDVVSGLVALVARTLPRSIEVVSELGSRTGGVQGDFSQLEHALMNLIVNARDAMPDGGRLTLATRDVVLDHDDAARLPPLRPGPHVVVEVSDTGTGVDPLIRHKIFEPYFSTKGKGSGTGLGLAMVYGIVTNHHGLIDLLDAHPGSTFRIYLPALDGVSPTLPAPRARSLPAASGRVLLVDDDDFVRSSTSKALSRLGYTVVSAASGGEALALFQAHRGEIAAVMLDMMMPGMDGRATYLALRQIDPGVRVLLTTGYAHNDETQELLDLGVRGFLAKPFDLGALSDALRKLLSPAGDGDDCAITGP